MVQENYQVEKASDKRYNNNNNNNNKKKKKKKTAVLGTANVLRKVLT